MKSLWWEGNVEQPSVIRGKSEEHCISEAGEDRQESNSTDKMMHSEKTDL